MELQKARLLALSHMKEHELLKKGWRFNFDNGKRRFGYCNYVKKIISLSKYLTKLNDLYEVEDTIKHEVAHALAGRGTGHGRVWRAHALAIGCSANRCYGDDVRTPKHTWEGTCPNCKRVIKRHRKKKSLACGKCCGKIYNPDYLFVWKRIT